MGDPEAHSAPESSGSTAGLGAQAARGAAITLAAQGGKTFVQVVSVIVLARLLVPHDFGLIAMVTTMIGVGELLRDFGLSSAAIQARSVSAQQRNNLFWINVGIGATLAVIVFSAGSAVLALVYSTVELVPISRALALTFLINGMTTQYRSDLVRRLRFRVLALADVLAPGLALVLAIVAAALGWGVWALVVQQLSQGVLLLLILGAGAHWLPGLPRRGVPMRHFLRFGTNLLATQLVGYLSNNIDTITVGVRFGSAPLGFYSRAFQLTMTPLNQVRIPLTSVALPVLSRLNDERERYADFVARGQLALGYTIAVGLGFAAAVAHPGVAVLLGPRWTPIAPLVALFAIAGVFQILAFVGYWVYVSRGLTGELFGYTMVSSAIKAVCILLGSLHGVLGVAVGYAVAPALSWPISLWWLSRSTSIPARRLWSGAAHILVVVLLTGGAAYGTVSALAPVPAVVQLVGALAAAMVVLAVIAVVSRSIRRDLRAVRELVALVRPRSR